MPRLGPIASSARYIVQPFIQLHRTWPARARLSRYVSTPKEIPLKNLSFGETGTERSRTHNAHPHPSGVAEPSQADELITQRLKDALSLVDIRILDHIIVAGGDTTSFAERGLRTALALDVAPHVATSLKTTASHRRVTSARLRLLGQPNLVFV